MFRIRSNLSEIAQKHSKNCKINTQFAPCFGAPAWLPGEDSPIAGPANTCRRLQGAYRCIPNTCTQSFKWRYVYADAAGSLYQLCRFLCQTVNILGLAFLLVILCVACQGKGLCPPCGISQKSSDVFFVLESILRIAW